MTASGKAQQNQNISDPSSERALVTAAQEGDRKAQEELFKELYPLVRKQLFFQLGNNSDLLDEAVQESMESIFKDLRNFRGDSKISTWAICIAIRCGRRYARKVRGRSAKTLYSLSQEDWHQAGFVQAPSEGSRQFYTLLSTLKAKKKEAFILMEILGFTAAEAGASLGISPNTAASRNRHAIQELRNIHCEIGINQ